MTLYSYHSPSAFRLLLRLLTVRNLTIMLKVMAAVVHRTQLLEAGPASTPISHLSEHQFRQGLGDLVIANWGQNILLTDFMPTDINPADPIELDRVPEVNMLVAHFKLVEATLTRRGSEAGRVLVSTDHHGYWGPGSALFFRKPTANYAPPRLHVVHAA